MSDPLNSYEICVKLLVEALNQQQDPAYQEAYIYQIRLLENIQQTKLYRDTSARYADRIEVLGRLNEITQRVFGKSFDDYCESNNTSSSEAPSSEQTVGNQPSIHESGYIRAVLGVAEKTLEMFNGSMWEARCKSICHSFLAIVKPNLFADNYQISSSDIELSSISHMVDELVKLLTSFCPNCEKTTKRVDRAYRDIQHTLNEIIEKCRTQLLQ